MIYKNEDDSIYKIEREKADLYIGKDSEEINTSLDITAVEKSIDEMNEVLNYLLRANKTKKPSKVPGSRIY